MWQMINLRELIKFSDWFKDSLSSCQKKLYSEMKNLTQKLWDFCFIKDKSKISSSEKIYYVVLNENESETVNNSFVDNDSNSSNSNNFMSAVLFTCSVSSVAVFNTTIC